MQIPVLVEPDYKDSFWANDIVASIKREIVSKKNDMLMLDGTNLPEIAQSQWTKDKNPIIIMIGTTLSWTRMAAKYLARNNISIILVDFATTSLNTINEIRGVVQADVLSAISQLINYLCSVGHSHIALYGVNPNSSDDMLMLSYFSKWSGENSSAFGHDVFYNRAALSHCYDDFKMVRSAFDSVICVNDIAALSLMNYLEEDGVKVPEDLYLTSVGNSVLTHYGKTPVTSAVLDGQRLGEQAVRLYNWLYKQEPVCKVQMSIQTSIVVRESTENVPFNERLSNISSYSSDMNYYNFFADQEVQQYMTLERLLINTDELDRRFVKYLVAGHTLESLESELFVSISTLRYRLKRLMTIANCESRDEFLALINWAISKRYF